MSGKVKRRARRSRATGWRACAVAGGLLAALPPCPAPVSAAPLENRVAVFAALDKITGEITTLEVPVDGEAGFGTFHIRPRTCHTRPPTEEPRTMAFVEIDEFTYDNQHRRIFTGWMNAESPGLHAVEHPLFDVWLTGCRQPLQRQAGDSAMPAPAPAALPGSTPTGAASQADSGGQVGITPATPGGKADALRPLPDEPR